MALSLVGAAPLPTVYGAPAGSRIAGAPNPAVPYDTVLPSGRILSPIGTSVIVGMNALGITLSPDGRYAIVSNDDRYPTQSVSRFNPIAQGGYSLAVVNTATMAVTDVFKENGLSLQLGVAALRDPANPGQTLVIASTGQANTVRFWQLDGAGKLHPDCVGADCHARPRLDRALVKSPDCLRRQHVGKFGHRNRHRATADLAEYASRLFSIRGCSCR